jgi:hypothetical protein
MSIQTINIGAVADDGTGDPLRTAFGKTNDNFSNLVTDINLVSANLSTVSSNVNIVAINLGTVSSNVNSIAANLGTVSSNVNSLTVNLGTVSSNVNSIAANVSNILTGTTSFSGNKTFTGNVGVGIAPAAKLHVSGTSSEKVIINMGGGTLPTSPAALNVWTNAIGTSTALSLGFSDGAASNRGGFTFSDIAAPGNWGVPRMDMTQSYGGASEIRSILGTEDTSWPGMKFTSQFGASLALTTSPSFVWNNYLTEQMRISANGFVGIGTNAPTARLHIAETWNNVSTTFTAIRSNVTDTASNAASLLMDLQVAGASKFRVGKDGQVSAGSFMMGFSPESTTNMSGLSRNGNNLLVNTVGTQAFNFSTGAFVSTRPIAIGPDAYTADVVLNRDAANILAQRNGTSAQTQRIYGTYTDASNYERGYLTANADGLTLGHEALGTGSGRAISLRTGSGRYLVLSSATTLDTNAIYTRFYSGTTVVAHLNLDTKRFVMGLGGAYTFSAGADSFDTAVDLVITRDAANTLAQRNGVNPQTHRIYNTYTDASNYERGVIGWTANALQIGTEAAGTGTLRNINLIGGNVGIGITPTVKLDVAGDIRVNSAVTLSSEAITLATVTKTQIASFPVASFRSGKLLVQAYDTITGQVQISEILVAHNVNSASHTEYGIVFTGATSIVAYDVDIASANVRLMATRTTTNSTQYKISETLIAS